MLTVANPLYDTAFKYLMQMNVEDEIQTSLNNRDETIKEQEQRIKEQEEQLIEKDKQINDMLATSIRLLLQNNVPVEVIAVNYGIDEEIVRRYQ